AKTKTTETYPKIYLYKRLVQAKLFMDAHFSERIDLDNISDEACFSKFHFTRLFKKTYGKTPHQYLTAVRLNKAMELLKAGMPVSEVCFAVGFESLGSFSALFKRFSGATPSDYFLQQQQLKEEILKAPLQFIPGCFAYKSGWMEKSGSVSV